MRKLEQRRASVVGRKHSVEQRIESVVPMIAVKARATYKKFPSSQLLGITVRDLINDGITWLLTVIKKYDPNKWTKFSTWAYVVLDNYYVDVLRAAFAECRQAKVLSADSTLCAVGKDREEMSLYEFLRDHRKDRREKIEDKIISRIDAERSFLKAYSGASPLLRKYMIRWFLQPKETKFKDGLDFRKAIAMFTDSPVMTEQICRTILTDHYCRLNIANALVTKFFTPAHPEKGRAKQYSETIEYDVLPILHPDRQKSMIAIYA